MLSEAVNHWTDSHQLGVEVASAPLMLINRRFAVHPWVWSFECHIGVHVAYASSSLYLYSNFDFKWNSYLPLDNFDELECRLTSLLLRLLL